MSILKLFHSGLIALATDLIDCETASIKKNEKNAEMMLMRRHLMPRPLKGPAVSREANWCVRVLVGAIMIFSFALTIYLGPLAIGMLNLLVQIKCFNEIHRIGVKFCHCSGFKLSRALCWYFLLASDYFFMMDVLIEKQPYLFMQHQLLIHVAKHHRLISFVIYSTGFVVFMATLDAKQYSNQLTLLAYTHLAILIASELSSAMRNSFEGIIWFLLPVSLIIFNDIMAYMFGFFFGRTRLIELSPKKTWEGFIGSALTTVLFGFLISSLLCKYDYFTRPVHFYSQTNVAQGSEPRRSYQALFEPSEYVVAEIGSLRLSLDIRPFYKHALVFSLFISLIGPFGGFYASGFKRAFKIKDFGNSIPGHGGFVDRFDCIALVIAFVSAYLKTFIRSPKPAYLFIQFLQLDQQQQFKFLELISLSGALKEQ